MTGRSFFVVVQTFFTMAPALVWLVGGLIFLNAPVGESSVSLGDMVAFTAIQTRLLFPLSGLLNRGVDVTSSLAVFDRIFEYLDTQPRIVDPENPVDFASLAALATRVNGAAQPQQTNGEDLEELAGSTTRTAGAS